jgi:CHASE1-domain containing sensor protein
VWAAVAVTLLGSAISVGQLIIAKQVETDRIKAHFETVTNGSAQALSRSFAATVRSVEGIAALFSAAPGTDRATFARYVTPLLATDQTLLNMAWAPRVPLAERGRYEEAAHADGATDFRFTERDAAGNLIPAAQRPEYVPLFMLEPLAASRPAFGFDNLSDNTRRAGAELARDSGKPAATAPFDLIQGGHGLVVYFPVYVPGKPVEDSAQRRALLLGFGVGTFRTSSMIDAIVGDYARQGVDIWVFDTASSGIHLVHAVANSGVAIPKDIAPDASELHEGMYFESNITIAGRPWRVLVRPTAQAITNERSQAPWIITGIGLFVTVLGAWFAHSTLRRRQMRAAQAVEAAADR